MNNDNLDRILSREENIEPSSGFISAVMDAVHHEAATPAPLPFPWKRAIPGLVACLALAAALIVNFAASLGHATQKASSLPVSGSLVPVLKKMFEGSELQVGTVWIIVVLLLSLATMQLSMRIAGGRNG